MRIFGGRFHSTARAPNQPDSVTFEDWGYLQPEIQVRFTSFSHSAHAYVLVIGINTQTVRFDTQYRRRTGKFLAAFPVQSRFSGASRQVLIEVLLPVLVIHLEQFWHDPATGGVVKAIPIPIC